MTRQPSDRSLPDRPAPSGAKGYCEFSWRVSPSWGRAWRPAAYWPAASANAGPVDVAAAAQARSRLGGSDRSASRGNGPTAAGPSTSRVPRRPARGCPASSELAGANHHHVNAKRIEAERLATNACTATARKCWEHGQQAVDRRECQRGITVTLAEGWTQRSSRLRRKFAHPRGPWLKCSSRKLNITCKADTPTTSSGRCSPCGSWPAPVGG